MKNAHSRLFLLLLCLLLLVGCTAAPAPTTEPPESASRVLNFPGLTWGMTPEEAIRALELTDAQQTNRDSLVLHNIRMTVFGAENADVYLYFGDRNGDGTHTLHQVMAILPYSTDMDAMARQIEAHYGIAPELTEKEQTDHAGNPMTAKRWQWQSEAVHQDIASAYDIETILALDEHYHSMLTDPVTYIILDNDDIRDHTLDGMHTKNVLTMTSRIPFYQFEGGYSTQTE